MSFEPRDYLSHILVEADYLLDQTAGLTRDEFVANETLRRAFVRSLEIVGEAAKKIPEEFRAQYPTVEWRAMSGMRDRPIHDCDARHRATWQRQVARPGSSARPCVTSALSTSRQSGPPSSAGPCQLTIDARCSRTSRWRPHGCTGP